MAEHASASQRAPGVSDAPPAGDITGALGTIRLAEASASRGWVAKVLTLLAVMGPGLIVMVGDNDAGGVSTYAQAGQNFGLSLLWTLPLLVPVLVVNQEMVVRLGAVTGVGHARLISERFGRLWGLFSVVDLFVLNFLTIVTEFIGVSLALRYFGVTPYVSVPLAAAALVAMTAGGSFRRWERFMLVFVLANFLVVPLAVLSRPHVVPVLRDLFVPGVEGGLTSTSVLLIIAIVGTTVAPWQLFFQQSNIVDKRIIPRFINYERTDTVIGSLVTVVAACLLVVTTAFAFHGTPLAGRYTDAGGVARGLARYLGHGAGALFAVVLLNASIIGAASVTLATSYAFGDISGLSHSLHRRFGEAKPFYASFSGLVVVAAGIVLIPHAPLGVITTAVQALAGVLLPSATIFLLLLCNDPAVLGPWVNRPWLNVLSGLIVSVLLGLSLILTATTVFPGLRLSAIFAVLAAVLVGGAAVSVVAAARLGARPRPELTRAQREAWRMPPLALLEPPRWTRGRRATMYVLRAYLGLAVALLVVKAVQLGLGHR
ncbi:MAG TPA: NRAMP family divalent metal transporter [Acidimicrobiales bacterium]|nr:NRAMP family divalent metal transporter [Acidimicrobiales bacterium]